MAPPLDITVITPTTGKPSLDRLIASMDRQTGGTVFHLLLWDQMRDAAAKPPPPTGWWACSPTPGSGAT